MDKIIYADNAATTPLSKRALEAMTPFFVEQYGNPSGIYSISRTAKRALEAAREQVAAAIGAKANEVYFTGGGSEADNWAIKSTALLKKDKGRHIITTAIEHHAVINTCEFLEKEGWEVTYLPVDARGNIQLEDLKNAIREDTVLISIMMANNEIGTIMPIAEIGEIAREKGILFHTDAVQAVGHIPVDVGKIHVDMLSIAAHKHKGPKGVGALYVKRGTKLPVFIHGGAQERGARAGTENIPGIVGFGAAIEEATENMESEGKRISAMRDRLIEGLTKIPFCHLTGDPHNRLPGTASFVFECVEGESMVLMLDRAGICASSGSACSSGSLDPSHVLLAIGLSHEVAHGSLRLTLGTDNSEEDVDYILETVPPIIEKLRNMSPLWEERKKDL